MKHENLSTDDTDNNPDVSPRNSDALSPESGAPNPADSISVMEYETTTTNNVSLPKAAPQSDWIANAIQTGRMLSSKEVSGLFGYRSRASFWQFVAKEGVPHIRLSRRNIRFPAAALQAWIDKLDSSKGLL